MRVAGIAGAVRGKHRPRTTQRDDTAPRQLNLVRRGWQAPTGIDQLWVADFSNVWILARFVYVAFVVFSRRILGWRSPRPSTPAWSPTPLRQALQIRRRAEHEWGRRRARASLRAGSQYVSVAFTAELIDAEITGSNRWSFRTDPPPRWRGLARWLAFGTLHENWDRLLGGIAASWP
jgi:hypothetical protein